VTLNADDLRRLADTLEAMTGVTNETGVSLCPYGSADIGVPNTNGLRIQWEVGALDPDEPERNEGWPEPGQYVIDVAGPM
jgi:hypothetical protein